MEVSTLNPLRVATWNLQRPTASQSSRRERMVAWLHKVNADVWVLTETHSAITPGGDFAVVATTTSDRPEEPGESWTAIWSRFRISALKVSADPARVVAARVEPPGRRPIVVYGTVLPWLGSGWRDVSAADGAAFAAALQEQTRDWKRIQADDSECDLIVAGDLNQDLVVAGDLDQGLAEKHFYGSHANRKVLAVALKAGGLTCLTGGVDDPVRLGGARAHATVDHLCVSARLVTQAQWPRMAWPPGPIPTETLTDHFGTAADFHGAS
jgi:endonuclease/exonuclease/phosphatase family metal-dependent hydrolase